MKFNVRTLVALSIFFTSLFSYVNATAAQELPEMHVVNYESGGLVTLRTHDVIPKSTNPERDSRLIEAYKEKLVDEGGYKAASCKQVSGYGLSFAVECVAFR